MTIYLSDRGFGPSILSMPGVSFSAVRAAVAFVEGSGKYNIPNREYKSYSWLGKTLHIVLSSVASTYDVDRMKNSIL